MVIRKEIWSIVEEMKIPRSLIYAIRSTYKMVRARIQIVGQTWKEFTMDRYVTAYTYYGQRRVIPRKKWIDQINEIGTKREKYWEEMRKMARQWKKWVQERPGPLS